MIQDLGILRMLKVSRSANHMGIRALPFVSKKNSHGAESGDDATIQNAETGISDA